MIYDYVVIQYGSASLELNSSAVHYIELKIYTRIDLKNRVRKMVKQQYKTEHMYSRMDNNLPVPPTVYDEPEKTLINFPSSIMNGVTQEGGLVSLTFKAIKCVELVENSDYMRRTILRDYIDQDPIRITEEKLVSTEIIGNLKKDIEELQYQKTIDLENDWISSYEDELLETIKNKGSLDNFKTKLFQQFEKVNGNEISFVEEPYKIRKVDIPGLDVQRFEDVKNIDTTPYQRLAALEVNLSQPQVQLPVEESIPSQINNVSYNNQAPEDLHQSQIPDIHQ